jgi:hypothetical protein
LSICRWFVGASILSVLIPLFPLINLYILDPSKRFWPISDAFVVSIPSHTAVYVLLIICGLFFTFGSLLLVRAFKEPPLPPLCACYVCATDEVFASWLFAAAVLVTVPVCAIYVYYFPSSSTYGAALAACGLGTILAILFAVAVYPAKDGRVSNYTSTSVISYLLGESHLIRSHCTGCRTLHSHPDRSSPRCCTAASLRPHLFTSTSRTTGSSCAGYFCSSLCWRCSAA